MAARRKLSICLATIILIIVTGRPNVAPAKDGDSGSKSAAVEVPGQNTPAEKSGALPSDRSAFRTPGSASNGGASEAAGKPRITPDKETTYIIKPLRDDGFPDYFAALNDHCRGSVQPENNAAVLLLEAIGPAAIPAEIQDEYFHLLGNRFQRPVGNYFVRMNEMLGRWIKGAPQQQEADREETLQPQFSTATLQPWSRSDFPMVAEWLSINEIPLKRIAEAARRPRFYEPIVSTNRRVPALWSVSLPMEQFLTEITTALEARAMLRAKAGNIDAAWDDFLCCHRLLRKVGGYPVGQYAMAARSMEMSLVQNELKLLHCCAPSAAQIERMRAQMAELPSMPGLLDRVEVGDRFRFLDAICLLNRQGPAALQQLFGDFSASTDESALQKAVADALFDWNEPLKMGNKWFDNETAICQMPERQQREVALRQIRVDLQNMINDANSPRVFALNWFTKRSAKAAFGRMVGATLMQLFDTDLSGTFEVYDQHSLQLTFAQIGMALAAYRADGGQYPRRLDDLLPKYLAKLPRDLYSEHERLKYHRGTSGYVLYSVGPNGEDEEGGESASNPNSDDIAVSISDAAPQIVPRQ